MSKKVLIILGHPLRESFCGNLANSYIKGAKKAGAQIKELYLGEINFDPVLRYGYAKIQELEEDLKKAQESIKWAEHIVFVFPIWWSSPPAVLKGFFDRIFLPGFAYKFRGQFRWDKYLTGRSAHLIMTTDSPPWMHNLIDGAPGKRMMKNILKFSGIKPIRISEIGSVKLSSEDKRKKWLENIGKKGEILI